MPVSARRLGFGIIVAVLAAVLAGLIGVAIWSAATPRPTNPLSGDRFYVDPASSAAQAAAADPSGGFDAISSEPAGIWLMPENQPTSTVAAHVARIEKDAAAVGEVPIFVVYGIPDRDCGSASAGGAASDSDYEAWVSAIARGLSTNRSIVILEPDALALAPQCGDTDRRVAELRGAITALAPSGATIYIDAGHSNWQSVGVMAGLLEQVGVDRIRGFSSNVSNFNTTHDEAAYDERLSARLGGAHFVIDTSRNGNGPAPDAAFCNPPGRRLGAPPRVVQDGTPLDATLWIKNPGESDGACNGGPPAGSWWTAGALALIAGEG